MESSSLPGSLPNNRIKAIEELKNGHTLINTLHEMHGRPDNIESDLKLVNDVVVQILGMFKSTLSILCSSNFNGIPNNHPSSCQNPQDFCESINTMTPGKTRGGYNKRRKNVPTITKFTSILIDDGYAWRKYGQKVINNSKHQRSYYRCSHRLEQGCQATKQVQKIIDEPSKYKTTYIGSHTCNSLRRSKIVTEPQSPTDNSILISFETNKNTFMENNKADTSFSSTKHIPMDGFLYTGRVKHEQFSSSGQ